MRGAPSVHLARMSLCVLRATACAWAEVTVTQKIEWESRIGPWGPGCFGMGVLRAAAVANAHEFCIMRVFSGARDPAITQ